MKKWIVVLFFVLFALVSCGQPEAADINIDTVVGDITAKYALNDGFLFTSSSDKLGEYLDEDLILGYYGDAADVPDFSKIASYCVYIDESDVDVYTDVGIFKMADPTYAETFVEYLRARIDDKIAEAVMYPTRDIPTLEASVFTVYGDYVYYVCAENVQDIVTDIRTSLEQ